MPFPGTVDVCSEYGLSVSETPANNTSILNAALEDARAAGGGCLLVPASPLAYPFSGTLGFDRASDSPLKVSLVGQGGRRSVTLQQVDDVPNFQLKTTSGNIRDFYCEGIHFKGGSVGVDLKDDAYNVFFNCSNSHQTDAGVRVSNGGSVPTQFISHWMTNVFGLCVEAVSGASWFSSSMFGEAVGGFNLNSHSLRLSNCVIFGATNLTPPVQGEGEALFRLVGGASLVLQGGHVTVRDTTTSLLYFHRGRDVLIDAAVLELRQCANLIACQEANTGTKPYPMLAVRPSRISSKRASGLSLYAQLLPGAHRAHRGALFDTLTEYVGTAPSYGADFAADASNTRLERARLDND